MTPTSVGGTVERIGSGTTAIVIADADGNMIAVTQTLSTWGGSFYVSRGLGFLYNNHLRSNRTTPGSYGQLLPLTRSNTANLPMLVFRDENGRQVPRLRGRRRRQRLDTGGDLLDHRRRDRRRVVDAAAPSRRRGFSSTRDPADPLGNAARVEIEDRFPRAIV